MHIPTTTRRLALLCAVLVTLAAICTACVKLTTVERLPLDDDRKAIPVASPTPTLSEGVCSHLALLGTATEADHMAMMVNAVVRPATGLVAAGSPANPTPQPGHGFVLVSLSITCEQGEGEVCALDPVANWSLVAADGAVARPQMGVSGVPGTMTRIEIPGGTTLYRGLVFDVAQGSDGLLLQYEQPAGSPQACLQVSAGATLPAPVVATPVAAATEAPVAVSPIETPVPPTATPIPPTEIEITVVFSPLETPAPPTTTPVAVSPLQTPTPPLPTATPIVFLPPSGQTGWPAGLLLVLIAGLLAAAGGLWLFRRARNRQ